MSIRPLVYIGALLFLTTSFLPKSEEDTASKRFIAYFEPVQLHYEIDSTSIQNNIYGMTVTLTNTSIDTVWLHSTSCSGEADLLRFDTTAMQLALQIKCNATYPKIIELLPGKSNEFHVYVQMSEFKNDFALGFTMMRSHDGVPFKSLKEFDQQKKAASPRRFIWAQ